MSIKISKHHRAASLDSGSDKRLHAITIAALAIAFWAIAIAPDGLLRRSLRSPQTRHISLDTSIPSAIPIDQITVGHRVTAHNPLLTISDRANFVIPNPQTWQCAELSHFDDDMLQTRVTLLRPPAWFQQHNVRELQRINLAMPEFGVEGDFLVTKIRPCPQIPPGSGSIVTATFAHQIQGSILAVSVEGMDKPLTVTSSHPFWSENQQAFVEIGHMAPGDTLRTADGQLRRLTNIETRAGPPGTASPSSVYWVYNLEVNGEHVYHVGQAGVTVHNKGTSSFRNRGAAINPFAKSSNNYRKTFFTKYPQLKGKVVVHHRVEQQVLKRYKGLFTAKEIHALKNLRGIPINANANVHLSAVRKMWNKFYKQNLNATKKQILDHAKKVDKLLDRLIGT